MTIQNIRFDTPRLSASEEVELARRIEAGLYADHLLHNPARHLGSVRLRLVVRRGREAWERMWSANLLLVMRVASATARRHVLPIDDLFQEGCLGLAEAMLRFDHARGWRFSTLAHEYIQRSVSAAAARRCGALEGPQHRHKLRQAMREIASDVQSSHQRDPGLREVASLAGVSVRAAAACDVVLTTLEEISPEQAATDGGFERVEAHGTQFLDLLAGAGELLRLRYGVGGRIHTLEELGERFGVSPSTVARQEARALQLARRLLDAEQCRWPAVA